MGKHRGLIVEKKALEVFEYHKKKKTKFPKGGMIKEVKAIYHFSLDDIKGKEIIVTFESGKILPITV